MRSSTAAVASRPSDCIDTGLQPPIGPTRKAPQTITSAAVTVETSSEGIVSGTRLVARSRTVQKPTEASAHSA